MYIIFKHLSVPAPELQKRLRDDFSIETFLFSDFKDNSVIRATIGKETDMQRLVAALGRVV
jgi:histidinol-phosphate/aromatic aminotransferase/cobyric acid decarboxylase-like protein